MVKKEIAEGVAKMMKKADTPKKLTVDEIIKEISKKPQLMELQIEEATSRIVTDAVYHFCLVALGKVPDSPTLTKVADQLFERPTPPKRKKKGN